MSSEQAAAMIEQLHSTYQALAHMQQELANQAATARLQHQETLQQTLTTAQNTNELAQQMRVNQNVSGNTRHFSSSRRSQISNIPIKIHDDIQNTLLSVILFSIPLRANPYPGDRTCSVLVQ